MIAFLIIIYTSLLILLFKFKLLKPRPFASAHRNSEIRVKLDQGPIAKRARNGTLMPCHARSLS